LLTNDIFVPADTYQCHSVVNTLLNCCLINARSLCNKRVELHHFMVTDSPDVLLVTESWLTPEYSSTLLADPKCYSLLRNDRSSLGGGVCVFIKSGIDFVSVDVPSAFNDLELLVFDILGVHIKYRFILSYCAPGSLVNNITLLTKAIDHFCLSDSSVVLCGDFNLPHINWACLNSDSDSISSHFIDCVQENAMVQHVNCATRKNNILDLVFTNDPFLIHDVNVDVPFSTSDHSRVNFKLSFYNSVFLSKNDKIFTDYSAVDWVSFNEYFMNINWSDVYSNAVDGDQLWSAFSSTLNNVILQFAPISIKHVRKSAACSYPKNIRKLISKKSLLWKKAKKFNTKQLCDSYRDCAHAVRKAIHAHTYRLESKLIESGDVGSFYRYVNKKLSSRSGVGCLKLADGSITNDPRIKADLLNNYFASVFTVDDGSCHKLPCRVASGEHLSSVLFTESKVLKKFRKIKPGTAPGPDGFQATLLKHACDSLALPLAQLYQSLFNCSVVPKEWKLAKVTPIFKKGKSVDVSNYRPISLTSLFCKIMESIIKDDILAYLLSKGLISRHQHGFLSRRSTGTQLIDCFNDWTLNIENKQSLDVIYIDFAKAFDSVVHRKLIIKLMSYGISGCLLSWLEHF